MRPIRFLLLVSLALLPGLITLGAEPRRLTVSDYFQKLPTGTLEAPAAEMWKFVQQTQGAIIDSANGYISCTGDGAQGDFTVALFRYKDDRPLLALCQGAPAETDYWYLEFFELGPGGKLQKAPRAVFPLADKPGRRFELPRKGRTIVVRDTKTDKVRAKYTWTGTAFTEEK